MSILFVFVDGLGIAPPGPSNPLGRLASGPLAPLCRPDAAPDGFRLLAADACLGVPGLPQSATGGASLFTGENAASLLGAHVQGLPNAALRELLCRAGLLRRAREMGARVAFANAYTSPFFERGRSRRRSVTTVMTEGAGLRPRGLDDLRAGRAVYRDFTNDLLRWQGIDVALQTPEQAGGTLGDLARGHDLLVYEFFQTDKIGHRGNIEEAGETLDLLNRFLESALGRLDPAADGFVLSSDHGSIEDMGSTHHTENPVPILLWGKAARAWPEGSGRPSICDVTPGVLSLLDPR